jgi:hypothetical protein
MESHITQRVFLGSRDLGEIFCNGFGGLGGMYLREREYN